MRAIEIDGVWKQYRYGTLGYGTLRHDLQSWWARRRGAEDPNAPVESGAGHRGRAAGDRDAFWALEDVSFDVEPGEVVGIVGRNGAGKSTLLKILSRVTSPTRGEIRLRGRVASLLEVGTGFHPDLTGRENVFLNGAILGMTRMDVSRKLDSIVEFADMARFVDTPVKRYSSGMAVRLAFSIAAHLEPEILIVDEVLAVGDAAFQERCIGRMREVSRSEGRTVLFVSHQMPAVERLCDRGVVLDEGRRAFDGTAREAVAFYLSQLGSSAVSLGGVYERDRTRAGLSGDQALIERVVLQDSNEQPTAAVRMGDTLTVAVDLVGMDMFPGAQVGLAVRNAEDQFVAHFTMAMKPPVKARLGAPRHRAVARVPRLALNRGEYSLDVAVAIDGVQTYDYVARALRFKVLEADFYGSGYRTKPEQGCVLLDGEWTVEAMSDSA